MPTAANIRPYREADREKVVQLFQLNTPAYFAPEEKDGLEQYLEHELEDYFIAEKGDTVVAAGGINYFPMEKTARLSWDLVRPDYQGMGIGSRLVHHRIEHIRKRAGVGTIIVRTSQLVFSFYRKMGFRLQKVEKDFWAEGYDLYEMEIDL